MKNYKNSSLVYMNYIWEANLVGLYEVLLFLVISQYIENFYLLLLVVGFSKHILGYVFNIHTWYCNNGYACINILKQNKNKKITYYASSYHLLQNSLEESIITLFFGCLLSYFLYGPYLFFALGIILHILSEKLGVHNKFCWKICNKKETN
jgi:hypothetical protein